MPPHRVGFLHRFGLKTGIHFAHFGLESSVVFEGTAGVYERFYRFNSKWVRKKEKYTNSKWIWIICLFALQWHNFCLKARSENGYGFTGLVWKWVLKITLFGLKSGQDFKNMAAHPHQELAGVPPGDTSLFSQLLKNKNRNPSIWQVLDERYSPQMSFFFTRKLSLKGSKFLFSLLTMWFIGVEVEQETSAPLLVCIKRTCIETTRFLQSIPNQLKTQKKVGKHDNCITCKDRVMGSWS